MSVWALLLGPAHAALVYDTSIVSFTDSASVTDEEGGGSTSDNNASLGTSELDQFDASLGVLTGVTINLTSTRDQSVTLFADTGRGSSTGSGSSTAVISAPGVSYTFGPITADVSCNTKPNKPCTKNNKSWNVNTNQNLFAATDNINSYVNNSGGGTVTVSRTAPTLSATQTDNPSIDTASTRYDLTWAGDLSATYSYLLHAAPSFESGSSSDSLTLDFGTVEQNISVSSLGFSIFNLADLDRTALDLVSFTVTGDTSALDSDLITFTNLSQGTNRPFYATLDTTNVGDYLATYTLTLSDAVDTGAASSQRTYTLNLTLKGTVAAAPVPVPDAVWLFGTGLVGIVGIARRNKPLDS